MYIADLPDIFKNESLKISVIPYADDLTILAASSEDVKWALSQLQLYCVKNKLTVNSTKTKIIKFRRDPGDCDDDQITCYTETGSECVSLSNAKPHCEKCEAPCILAEQCKSDEFDCKKFGFRGCINYNSICEFARNRTDSDRIALGLLFGLLFLVLFGVVFTYAMTDNEDNIVGSAKSFYTTKTPQSNLYSSNTSVSQVTAHQVTDEEELLM
ncbi:hypothetical protein GJ496_001780 [Pomphorhynchus laevis]|nr:hypothetical protein GJ496_001780 [Pomphorhynchus laevis]